MIKLGNYRHYKGKMYEVTGFSTLCTGKELVGLVHYKSLEADGLHWSRTVEDFTAIVDGNPRFMLIKPLDAPADLLEETIKIHKGMWDQCKADDPAWLTSGSGRTLQYLVGDKISFALSIRIITRAKAEELLDIVRKWD